MPPRRLHRPAPTLLLVLALLLAPPLLRAADTADTADTTDATEGADGAGTQSWHGWNGQWRLRGDDRQPGSAPVPPEPDSLALELELRGQWRRGALGLNTRLQWQGLRPRGGASHGSARVDELAFTGDHGAWQSTAGRKVVGWDVGQAFRPNDLVQQEARLTLLPAPLQGRPLLQLEHFGAESSTALVWVNPQHLNRSADATRGPDESALAARWYGRMADGAADVYAFARLGRHTGASLGLGTTWVASEALALYGSARLMQRHDGWQDAAGSSGALLASNPWQLQTLGRATQALAGASWTGESQQSLLVEAWWDGTAPSNAQWDAWNQRNTALASLAGQPGVPPAALAGNQAWQATPLAGVAGLPALRRENLFVRASWQPGAWTAALDLWFTPADRGRSVTTSLQWQGDRVSLQAALRWMGGPPDAVLAQLPVRRSAAVMASWAF